MGELIELLDSVCEANGELLWEVMRWDGETRSRGEGIPRRNWLPLSKVP